MKVGQENNISKEVLDAIIDEKKMSIREKILTIHKKANKTKIFYLNTVQNRAVAAAIAIIFIVGGAVISYDLFTGDTNHELIAENYSSANLDFLYNRGNLEADSKMSKAIAYYNNRQYSLALKLFKSVDDSIIASLYSGYCYMMLGNYDTAEDNFIFVINDENNLMIDQAEWSLAQCYLNTNKTKLAKEMFTKISKEDNSYKNKAKRILETM